MANKDKNILLDEIEIMMNERTGEKLDEVVDLVLDKKKGWEDWFVYVEKEKNKKGEKIL